MQKLLILSVLLALTIIYLPAANIQAQDSDDTLGLYDLFETSFTVEGEFENPYDTQAVSVTAAFTSPSGQRITIPAFYMEPLQQVCTDDCTAEVLEPAGSGEWRVRFTPTEPGRWRYVITAVLEDGTQQTIKQSRFQVAEGQHRGFIEVAPNARYFQFQDGTPYFPVGMNLGWSWENGGGIFAFIEWLDKLQAAGTNYARVNIDVPWFIGLEWTPPAGQYGGEGQIAAWRLDQIVQAAAERDIYLQLVLIWHRGFQDYPGAPVIIPNDPPRAPQNVDFDNHPYNNRFSGSLAGPSGLFRDSISQRLLEQRLRYIVARWGYSPNIFAWEITDRLDEMAAFSTEGGIEWLNTLTNYVRELDVNNHLVTVGLKEHNIVLESAADIDFTQTIVYQDRPLGVSNRQVEKTFERVALARAIAPRPVLVNEFSLNPWFEPINDDEAGVHVSNTMWAAILSGAAGSAMPFWWDTYIDARDFYGMFGAVALFARDLPWNTLDFELFEPGLVGDVLTEYAPLRLDNFNRLFRSPSIPDTIYHVTADGAAPPVSITSSYLYGRQFNSENSRPQTFIISPPVDTEFIIGIENVSTAAPAQLLVTIDGETRTRLDLAQGTRELNLNFPLAAGTHTVVLDNLGEDWLQLAFLEIADYIAPLRALALVDEDAGISLIWIHHRDYTWDTVQGGEQITPLGFQLNLPQLAPGNYLVEFWDPLTGQVIGQEHYTATTEAPLTIELLPVSTQLALRIFRLENGAAMPESAIQPTRTPSAPS